jgi:glutamate-ammonia-ligase adenylyltransferase
MHHSHFLTNWKKLPQPADRDQAAAGFERWHEAVEQAGDPALSAFARDLAQDPAGPPLLDAIFGNSPFLTRFRDHLIGETDTDRLMQELRRAKRRAALTVALADMAGVWPLGKITAALSALAETALGLATAHLLRGAAADGDLVLPDETDPERGSGFFVLGMGKLGAEELNYSSDIDLIVLYDDERITYTGSRSLQDCFVRLTRNLVRIMEARTQDGYVFRTDLRLRPDPGATPVAMSVLAAETYYESMGQNWERAAMIKARPVAGDREAAAQFLAQLTPYVWRKYFDFAAIQDIHSIKRQIDTHRGIRDIKVAGHNLKLGRGGIREIEFFAQTQQLIWGGRMPSLRVRSTREALVALAAAGRISRQEGETLSAAYRFLRRAEHRLQMVDDRQTQTLPADRKGLERIAVFLGYSGGEEFSEALLGHLRAVEHHYRQLFSEAPSLGGPGNLVFTGGEPDPETLETLTNLGFKNAAAVSSAIMGWHHGRYPATRSARTREMLTELMPALLAALSRTADPDAAFMKFDEFLSRLPAGVQLFSLFQSNPGLLDLVAEIMGEELAAALARAGGFEEALDVARRWTNDKKFQLGVHILDILGNITKADAAGPMFADVADVVLRALIPWAEEEFAHQHGYIPGADMAVIAFGKLGGREMMVGSDLDLVFVYQNPAGAALSDGRRPLSHHEYYARLSRRLISAITALTAEGRLYQVEEGAAWTWEHQALTRARVIAGPRALRRPLEETMREVLTRPRDPARLAADVAEMRARIARERPEESIWAIKDVRGGLIDVEFITQFLQLRYAHDHPEILSHSTIEALRNVADAGLIPAEAGAELIAAAQLWQRILGLLRLCHGDYFYEETAHEGARKILAEAGDAADFGALKKKMVATGEAVRRHFRELIEGPAAAAAPQPAEDPDS